MLFLNFFQKELFNPFVMGFHFESIFFKILIFFISGRSILNKKCKNIECT
jgi:hypothetical protein